MTLKDYFTQPYDFDRAGNSNICPDCNGCGWDNPAQALYKCERCDGSGVVTKPHASDGEKCWCGSYHPTDEDIGIYE